MFKKTQKYLLINQPLLWNTKVVPVTCFLLFAHIIFFIIGFFSGNLNFTETENHYSTNNTDVVAFFSVLIAILALILWLVYYFKNNAFKSFYPKSTWSLFKEWLILVFVSMLLCTLHLSYLNGYDAKIKSYYSEKEATKRCDIISKASIFYGQRYGSPLSIDTIIHDTLQKRTVDYMFFDKKKYSSESLMNKENYHFNCFTAEQDSLTNLKVKRWLVDGKTDSLKAIFRDYFKLVKEHQLQSNINEDKWFSIVYNPPGFNGKRTVARRQMQLFTEVYYGNNYENPERTSSENNIDTINEYAKTIKDDKYLFYKHYVPADELEYNYDKIISAYQNPSVSSQVLLVTLYFAFALSILIFSYKVTSGRSWLIALLSIGIYNVLLGIMSAMASSGNFYLGGMLVFILATIIYFIIIIVRKTKKGFSSIVLALLLWLIPVLIPIIYALLLSIMKMIYRAEYSSQLDYSFYDLMYKKHPIMKWLEDNIDIVMWINLAFVTLVLLWLSAQIRKWKGIAEG